MARTVFRVVPDGGGWVVKKEGMPLPLGRYGRKREASAEAHQPSQLVIHDQEGEFQTECTYGDDPFPPAG